MAIRKPTDDPQDNNNNPIMSFREEFLANFDAEFPTPTRTVEREDIGGLDDIIEQLDTFKRAIAFPKLYEAYGVNPPKGFILTGPPGCGKTYIARYLANDMGARFMDVPLNKYESKWVGEAEKKLVEIINQARMYRGLFEEDVLIFFDEAEEAFKSRQMQGWHGPRVNALLREMDGIGEHNDGVYFGAATNHLDIVDKAILRPGRLDYHITIGEYSKKGLADVVRAISTRLNRRAPHLDPYILTPEDYVKLGDLAKQRDFTPAYIYESFRRAADVKIKEMSETKDLVVTTEDFYIYEPDLREAMLTLNTRDGPVKRKIGFT